MFYRFEIRTSPDSPWEGGFQYLFPDQIRYITRFVREPKWYQNHPDINTRCWFTQEGFTKYGDIIQEAIEECGVLDYPNSKMRILKRPSLENIVMHGKIQCIQLIENN